MNARRTLIIGAGMAGVSAAEALRSAGYNDEILMIGDEGDLPYHRPPLSKHFLAPEPISQDEMLIQPPTFYRDQAIQLEPADALMSLDLVARQATLRSGRKVGFDQALVATGARARRFTIPGSTLDGVTHLRTLRDGMQLAHRLRVGTNVVVIGAGLIGLEVASAARDLGKRVVVLEASPAPLTRLLGHELGALVAQLHRDHGVELRTGVSVSSLHGGSAVESVRLSTGEVLTGDTVVVSVGVEPNVEAIAGTEIALDSGVLVDEFTRTNVPGVFAAGDVARAWNPWSGERVRLEQVGNARAQAVVAARTMMGQLEPYAPLPSMASQQHRQRMQSFGVMNANRALHVRGSVAARSFVAFYLRDERIVGAFALNRARDAKSIRLLVEHRAAIPPRLLTDDQVALDVLCASDPPRWRNSL